MLIYFYRLFMVLDLLPSWGFSVDESRYGMGFISVSQRYDNAPAISNDKLINFY